MSDIHFSKSPEQVAMDLMYRVMSAENLTESKEYILSTYAECLHIVQGKSPSNIPKIRSA